MVSAVPVSCSGDCEWFHSKGWSNRIFLISLIALASGAIMTAGSPLGLASDVRIVDMRGTKLYIPSSWPFEAIRTDVKQTTADSLEGFYRGRKVVRPGETFVGYPRLEQTDDPPVADILIFGFCRVERDWRKGKRPLFFSVVGRDEMPKGWCIQAVELRRRGPEDVSKLPRLGPKAYPEQYIEKYYGPIADNGFRRNYFSGAAPKAGNYLGFLETDVTPAGGPIAISCDHELSGAPFYRCKVGGTRERIAVAISGVYAKRFEWLVEDLDPDDLRAMYWNSQRFLEWLATPSDKRPAWIIEPGFEKG